MDSKRLKQLIRQNAIGLGFESKGQVFFHTNATSVVTLDLQKSLYSNSYYLNICVYVKGYYQVGASLSDSELLEDILNGNCIALSTRLLKKDAHILDLDNSLSDLLRESMLQAAFQGYVNTILHYSHSLEGVRKMIKLGILPSLPVFNKFLGIRKPYGKIRLMWEKLLCRWYA